MARVCGSAHYRGLGMARVGGIGSTIESWRHPLLVDTPI